MQLLQELLQINNNLEMEELLEELGNLGKLGLGSMVNAFKQTYSVAYRGQNKGEKHTGETGKKFSRENSTLGKDSEAVDGGNIKNWMGLKRVYNKYAERFPLATIFTVDDKPVALMIADRGQLESINDKVALAWDFSKVAPTDEEAKDLVKGLNTKGELSWKEKVFNSDRSLAKSERSDNISKEEGWGDNAVTSFTTKKFTGFTQTVREVVPFINNLASTFKTRLEVKLILADQERTKKQSERRLNRPIDPKELTLFKDDIKTRLAKYKNSKVDTAEDAADFVKKVFAGGMKKLRLAGSTYSAIPSKKYTGSANRKHEGFYNGTMQDLFTGKSVTMEFEADRAERDYHTLYLTVKLVKGQLVPVEARYTEKDGSYGKAQVVKF